MNSDPIFFDSENFPKDRLVFLDKNWMPVTISLILAEKAGVDHSGGYLFNSGKIMKKSLTKQNLSPKREGTINVSGYSAQGRSIVYMAGQEG